MGDASATDDVELATFEFKDDEIVGVAEKLPAIVIGDKTYVCGDTGGLPVDMAGNTPVHALGLNLPEITETLINRFVPEKIAGCAFLRIDPEIFSIIDGNSISGLLVFLRQTIHCELGSSREIDLSFNSFALLNNGEKLKLSSNQQVKMMKAIFRAQRSKGCKCVKQDLICAKNAYG